MKSILYTCVFFTYCFVIMSCGKQAITGTYHSLPHIESLDETFEMSIVIKKRAGTYHGWVCSQFKLGKDCRSLKDEPTFSFPLEHGEEVTVDFYSQHVEAPGKVKLIFNPGTVTWLVIIPTPPGHFLPKNAVLVK